MLTKKEGGIDIVVLYVILGLILLIALILSIRASIHIVYEDELSVYLKILFFKFRIFPEGKVKFNLKSYERRLKGEQRLQESLISQMAEESKKNGLIENIKMIADLISTLIKSCAPYMRVKLARVHISVGSSDAAKTAILYGAISGAVALLVDNIDEYTNLEKLKKKSIIVEPDFLSEKTSARIHISLSISVYGAIATILKTMIKTNYKSVNNTLKGI